MMKKTIVFGILSLGAILFFIPEPEFSFSQVTRATSEKWVVRSLTHQNEKMIQSTLSQPFTYIGCGAQAYVFFSEDGSSVLKLFKKKRFEVPTWIRLLPKFPYKTKKMIAKRENLIKDFTSYQIAYNELQEETGLLLVHLDATPLNYSATLIDQEKQTHTINLSDYAFILQKRGELVYPTLDRYVREGNMASAKESIISLVRLLKERCDKGVIDRDPNFSKNYAFIGTKAIEIDIGRFSHAELPIEIQTPKISQDFKTWLQALSPKLYAHFEEEYQTVFLNPIHPQEIKGG